MDVRPAVAQPPVSGAREFAIAVGILLALGAAGCLRAGRKAEGRPRAAPEKAPAVDRESAAEKERAQPAAQDVERPEEHVPRAKEEEEAEELRRRALKMIEGPNAFRARAEELLEKYPDTQAARKLRESGLLELALKRQKEDEDAAKALTLLKARLRNLVANGLYKEATAAALQSSEYRR